MSNWAIDLDGSDSHEPAAPQAELLRQVTENESSGVAYNQELQEQLYEHAPGKLAQGLGIEIEAPDAASYNTLLHFALGNGLQYDYNGRTFRIFPTS